MMIQSDNGAIPFPRPFSNGGRLAQMGERLLYTENVGSSILSSFTNFLLYLLRVPTS